MLELITSTFTQGRFLLIGIVIVAVSAVSGYAYHKITVLTRDNTISNQNIQIEKLQSDIRTLQANQATYVAAAQENEQTIRDLQTHALTQANRAQELTTTIQRLEGEKQRYLAIFREHDLTKLSRAKPGLIESRINQGTQDVFRGIEQDTK